MATAAHQLLALRHSLSSFRRSTVSFSPNMHDWAGLLRAKGRKGESAAKDGPALSTLSFAQRSATTQRCRMSSGRGLLSQRQPHQAS